MSFGVFEINKGMLLKDAVKIADDMLYQAKTDGRNRVSSYQNAKLLHSVFEHQ